MRIHNNRTPCGCPSRQAANLHSLPHERLTLEHYTGSRRYGAFHRDDAGTAYSTQSLFEPCLSTNQASHDEHTFTASKVRCVYPAGSNIVTTGVTTMFSHESVPLIIIFIVMLVAVLAAFLHPVHALYSWLRRRRERSAVGATEKEISR